MKRGYLFLFLGVVFFILAGLFMKSQITGMMSQLPWPGPTTSRITGITINGIFKYSLVRENPAGNGEKVKTWFVTRQGGQDPLPPGVQNDADRDRDTYYSLADVQHLQPLLALLQSAHPTPVDPPKSLTKAKDPMRVVMRDDRHEWLFELTARPLPEEKRGMTTVLVSYDGGKRVALQVESRFGELLRKPVNWYTDLRLFSIRQDNVSRFEILWPSGETWTIERNRDGAFAFAKPDRLLGAEVPQAATEYVLHSVTTLHTAELFTNLKPLRLPSPYIAVRLWTKGDDNPQELLIYRLKGEGEDTKPSHDDFTRSDFGWGEIFLGYSSRQNGFFVIPADRVTAVGKSLMSLRSRPLLQGVLKDVSAAELTVWDRSGGTRHFSFARKGDAWYDAAGDTPLVGMETLIWRLGAMQGESDLLDDREAPKTANRGVPLVRWEFTTGKGPVALEFRTGNGPTPRYWVSLGDKEPWYAVSSTFVSEMLSHLPAPDAGAEARENAAREARRQMRARP